MVYARREAPSAPPLGELLSEREAEGVRYEIWVRYKIRTTPPQSARSGCQLQLCIKHLYAINGYSC